jgi:hypothetical protein
MLWNWLNYIYLEEVNASVCAWIPFTSHVQKHLVALSLIKTSHCTRHQMFEPTILAIWEAETEKIVAPGHPRQNSLRYPIFMEKIWAW